MTKRHYPMRATDDEYIFAILPSYLFFFHAVI